MVQMLKGRLAVQPNRLSTQEATWRAGKTTAERGYGGKWQKARLEHLRANPQCVMCLAEGRHVPATVVDHSTPHNGDMTIFWDRSRWVSLCPHHHNSDKQSADNRERYRYVK